MSSETPTGGTAINRQLLNIACVVGALTFVGAIIVQFVQAPPPKPALQRVLTDGSPVELATQVILTQHDKRSLNHRVWQRVANLLLRDEDPYAQLVELDVVLGDGPQESIAATGYSAYYTGYSLLLLKAHEQAERCWEFGLESFEEWSEERRPWLDGNDTLYHARTLMRLGRDEEAYQVLRRLPHYADGAPDDLNALIGLFRTLAEIGHEEDAMALCREYWVPQDDLEQNRLIRSLLNGGRMWGNSFEYDAARVALNACEETLLALLQQETTLRPWVHEETHRLSVEFQKLGDDERSEGLGTAGEHAAIRVTADQYADPLMIADAWRWVAKYRARGNNPQGAAEAIRQITPGVLHGEDLLSDPDLARYADVPEVRAAIRLHGVPANWDTQDNGLTN